MSRTIDFYTRQIFQMSSWEWFAVMAVVLAMGVFCLRGFGSRTTY